MSLHQVRRLAAALLALLTLLVGSAEASHFRFGHVYWRTVPPPPAPSGVPQSVTFSFPHANCGGATNTWGFFLNGTQIATEGHTAAHCQCGHVETYAYTDPSILALVGAPGTNTAAMTASSDGDLYFGTVTVTINYAVGSEQAFPYALTFGIGCGTPEIDVDYFGPGHFSFPPATFTNSATGGNVEITILEGWRANATQAGSYQVRNAANVVVATIDAGGTAGIIASGTDVAGEQWNLTRAVRTLNLPVGQVYTVTFTSCCRIYSLINASGNSMTVSAQIDLRGGNTGSPVSSLPVILQMNQGQLNQIPLPIADPDGDPFACRLATSAESSIASIPTAGGLPLGITAGCILTWDTQHTAVGQKYAAQVIIEENSAGGGGRIPLDFIIEIVGGTANLPPTCASTVGHGATVVAPVGQPLVVDIVGTDPEGQPLRISHLGLPSGAVLTPAAGATGASPMSASFTWTPSAADAGTVQAVTVIYTDPMGLQALCSFAISIPSNSPPVCTILTAPGVATVGVPYMAEILVEDPDNDDVSITVSGLSGTVDVTPSTQTAPYQASLTWTPGVGDAGQSLLVTVTVDDGLAIEICTFPIAAVNRPPVAVCNVRAQSGATPNSPGVFECETPSGTEIVFDGSGSYDPDGDVLRYTWIIDGTSYDATSTGGIMSLMLDAGVGATSAVLVVQDVDAAGDAIGGVADCNSSVAIEDTTPPTIRCVLDKGMLWPPNHKMRTIALSVEGMDACTSPQDIVIQSIEVWSDEPDNGTGLGDGNTIGDVNGSPGYWDDALMIGDGPVLLAIPAYDAGTETFPTSLELRAEREGTGTGRCYTIRVTAVDHLGNVGVSTCCIFVPHNMGQ